MAGEWIKFEIATFEKPEVFKLARNRKRGGRMKQKRAPTKSSFNSKTGRQASRKSPWRNRDVCNTPRSRRIRKELDEGQNSGD